MVTHGRRRLWDAITTASGKASYNGRRGRHAGTGTVDGPGVVVADVCGGWEYGWATRLTPASGPREVDETLTKYCACNPV